MIVIIMIVTAKIAVSVTRASHLQHPVRITAQHQRLSLLD
jgi:hypothetical protein